ncbi:MAG TPA: histidine kinase [Pyrinomonadaceae bacterium]|nr:histidine kinase [Pyrinomonadaceae bacterium]
MDSLNAALLVNLLGFSVGIALYALVAVMVLRHRGSQRAENANILLLTTSALGLLWNVGELYGFVQKDFGGPLISPLLVALSFSALGFLPSVVVHSAQAEESGTHWLTFAAYGFSVIATLMHFQAALSGSAVPSDLALQTLTFGSLALSAGLLLFNLRQTLEKKAVWAAALLVFAVSALHLSGEREGTSWYVELIAHQSSLLLALVILYQNYRFAFADLFLKRAISLMLLTVLASGLYVFAAVPLLRYHETHDRDDVQAAALILGLWVATALVYPLIYKFAVWLVDKVLLHRVDYAKLQQDLAREVEDQETLDDVLGTISERLAKTLTARSATWTENVDGETARYPSVNLSADDAGIIIPTAETPQYTVRLSAFFGGRRLLSDEISLLESVALVTARRIDVLRVSHERFEQKFREQEFAKLATEAQLTALRSQINPHFLFNALTTIGYLIKTSPDKAFDTLLRLTQLLRGVLKSTGEFSTLGDEIKLIESYLDIEHARFEERLRVNIDVPHALKNIKVPSLILQPIVENAIKHGISENKNGGEVRISAAMTNGNSDPMLRLTVWDSGPGKHALITNATDGVGLRNIRERLSTYYGKAARLTLATSVNEGTDAVIDLPVKKRCETTD